MSLSKSLSCVCDQLRDHLVQMAAELPSDGMTPAVFRTLLANLKDGVNRAGIASLEAFVADQEVHSNLVEHGDQQHRFKSVGQKLWLTPFGPLSVARRYFQPDCGGEGVIPIDVRCGMKERYATPDVEEVCAKASAMMVPREIEDLLSKILPAAPSATAIQKVIKQVGSFAEANFERIEEVIQEEAPMKASGDILVISWDGVMAPLKKNWDRASGGGESPDQGEGVSCPTVWKEAGVATLSIYEHDPLEERALRKDTRYFARMPEAKMKRLLEQLEGAVEDLCLDREFEERVVLCDGKRAIWKHAEMSKHMKDATFILDFFHAAEHLSQAADAAFGEDSEKGRKWYSEYRARLKEDPEGVMAVIRSLRYYVKKTRHGSKRSKSLKGAIRYFQGNKDKMDYAKYRERGLPIGSGPVEAACKTVVGHRLKRSGMRWTLEGGQQVLNLRVYHLSKRWDAFWNCYMSDRNAA
jgi:hypothetical protein